MAESKLGIATVSIRAALDDLDKDFETAKGKADTAAAGISQKLGNIKWAAVGASATALTGVMADLAREGAADAAGMEAVRVAAENAGASWDEAEGPISNYINRMRDVAAIGDDTMKPALASLIAVTGDYGKAMELASISADLARGKNMSYEAAAQLVGKVAMGNTSALTRYGIVLGENATAEEALAELQKRFAGQAEAYGSSVQGQLESTSARIGDFREDLGNALGPAQLWLGMLPGLSAGWTMLGGVIGPLLPMLGGVGTILTGTVIPAVTATIGALAPFALPILAIIAVLALLVVAWQNNWGDIQGKTAAAWEFIQSTVGAAWAAVSGAIQTGLAAFGQFWSDNWQTIQQGLSFAWDAMTLGVRVAWTLLSGIITAGIQIFQGDWDGAWETIRGTLSSIWDQMSGVVRSGVNLIIGFINTLVNAWNGIEFNIPGFSVPIPSVDVPFVGRVGGGTLGWGGVHVSTPDLPQIPLLDSGGVVRQPTLAALAMNNRPEAVVPLGRGGYGGATINLLPGAQITVTGEADEDRLIGKMEAMLERFAGQMIGDQPTAWSQGVR